MKQAAVLRTHRSSTRKLGFCGSGMHVYGQNSNIIILYPHLSWGGSVAHKKSKLFQLLQATAVIANDMVHSPPFCGLTLWLKQQMRLLCNSRLADTHV
jgi:hypothetical protein